MARPCRCDSTLACAGGSHEQTHGQVQLEQSWLHCHGANCRQSSGSLAVRRCREERWGCARRQHVRILRRAVSCHGRVQVESFGPVSGNQHCHRATLRATLSAVRIQHNLYSHPELDSHCALGPVDMPPGWLGEIKASQTVQEVTCQHLAIMKRPH